MKTRECKLVDANFIPQAKINSSEEILTTSLERAIEKKMEKI